MPGGDTARHSGQCRWLPEPRGGGGCQGRATVWVLRAGFHDRVCMAAWRRRAWGASSWAKMLLLGFGLYWFLAWPVICFTGGPLSHSLSQRLWTGRPREELVALVVTVGLPLCPP